MEGEVELRQVLAPGVAFAPVDEDPVELREQRIVRRRNHIARDAELEVLTGTECLREVGRVDGNVEREQVEHRVDREAPDEQPRPNTGLDVAERLQRLRGLANGVAAHAQLLREVGA